jgi:hypothetical protein
MSDIRDKLASLAKQLKSGQQLTAQNAVAYIVRLEMKVDQLQSEVGKLLADKMTVDDQLNGMYPPDESGYTQNKVLP